MKNVVKSVERVSPKQVHNQPANSVIACHTSIWSTLSGIPGRGPSFFQRTHHSVDVWGVADRGRLLLQKRIMLLRLYSIRHVG